MKYLFRIKISQKSLKILMLLFMSASVLSPLFVNCSGGFQVKSGTLSSSSSSLVSPDAIVALSFSAGTPDIMNASSSFAIPYSVTSSSSAYVIKCTLNSVAMASCASPITLASQPDGDYSLSIVAQNSNGFAIQTLSRTFRVDRMAPTIMVASQPAAQTGSTSASVQFSVSDNLSQASNITTQCMLDSGAYTTCTSPMSYSSLTQGAHTIKIKATDQAGNTSPTTSLNFSVVLGIPTVTISQSPSAYIKTQTASFVFSGTSNNSTITGYECSIDNSMSFAACTSPKAYSGLVDGTSYNFAVRSIDASGQKSGASPVHFTVDLTPPTAPSVTSNLNSPNNQTSLSLSFSASDKSGIASYQCSQDGGTFVNCSSPRAISGLTSKGHSFQVKATDQAGNVSAAGSYSIVIDLDPPSVSITSNPANPTVISGTSTTASFSFTSSDALSGVALVECFIDTETAYSSCTSPKSYPSVGLGNRSFNLRVTDKAGNSKVQNYSWLVSSSTTTTPPPGQGGGGGGSGSSPLPTNMGQLFGCTNPYGNNSVSYSDWGASSWNYADESQMTQIGNYPTYSSNIVFWTSREAGPGVPVLMSGAFTSNAKTIRLLAVTPGMTDWQTPLRASTTTVAGTNMASTGLRFAIPASFPSGTYAVRIEDDSTAAVELLINAPKIEWAMGTPMSTDALEAPKHQLHTCGTEAGGILRIFGKNFSAQSNVILHDQGSNYYQLSVINNDENSISVSVPSSVSPGSYYLWIGSSNQDASSSLANPVTIYANSTATLSMMTCNGLNGDGSTDNTQTIKDCLNANKASASASNPYYLSLPSGNFVITDTVTLYPHQYIIGDSLATTTITAKSSSPPTTWIQGSNWFGLENLSMVGPVSSALIQSDISGDPALSGHILFNNISVVSGNDSSGGNQEMVSLSGPDIRIISSQMDSSSNVILNIVYGDGAQITTSNFNESRSTWISLMGDQNFIFDKNTVHGTTLAGGGVSYARPFWQYVPSMITQNIYNGYDTFVDVLGLLGQGITTDGGTQGYMGNISSANSNTVTLQHGLDYQWIGASNPQTFVVTIHQGRGVGEYRMVQSVNGQTLTLDHPWDVVPDQTSILSVSSSEFRVGVSHSTFTNVYGGAISYFGNTFESTIENNQLSNGQVVASGMLYGPYYLPLVNLDMINNSVVAGQNTVFNEEPANSGYYSRDFQGILVSGIYMRGNTVQAPLTFNLPNSVSGTSSYLIEGNKLTFDSFTQGAFLGSNPGILTLNNN